MITVATVSAAGRFTASSANPTLSRFDEPSVRRMLALKRA